MMSAKNNSAHFIFIFLGMLTAFAPFVTDMYLPSLPIMTSYFNTSISMVQMGLTFSMLGLAAGQLIFGPLSDKFGRRKPLIMSIVLFIISTFFCIYAPTIEAFVVGAINGIAPIAAPVIGGMMVKLIGWRGIFMVLLCIGGILLILGFHFQESLSRPRRSKEKLSKTLKMFKAVFQNKKYILYTLQLSFCSAILFAYIASSPFIIQKLYGFSPFEFSLFFGANAIAIGIGAGLSVRYSPQTSLKISIIGLNLCCWTLLLTSPLQISIIIFEALLFILSFMLGMSFTTATAIAMDAARNNAGTASAILGAAGFLFGSIVSPLVGLGNIMLSTRIVLVICVSAATLCYHKAPK